MVSNIKQKQSNILTAIGNTPIVELVNLNGNPRVKIFGKLEGNNPGGSVKDRPAYYMIKMAEASGELTREKTIVEPTSGNMGIALAMIGAAKGYRVKLYMPECVSVERQLIDSSDDIIQFVDFIRAAIRDNCTLFGSSEDCGVCLEQLSNTSVVVRNWDDAKYYYANYMIDDSGNVSFTDVVEAVQEFVKASEAIERSLPVFDLVEVGSMWGSVLS